MCYGEVIASSTSADDDGRAKSLIVFDFAGKIWCVRVPLGLYQEFIDKIMPRGAFAEQLINGGWNGITADERKSHY